MHRRVMTAIAALDDHLGNADFSGTIAVSRGGEILFEHAAGYANRADRVPNTIDTRFGTASLTKSFTATAVCRLVEQGAVPFLAPVVELLPPAKRPAALSSDVTVHHLLTHTSGIADYYDEVTLGAAAYEQIWLEHPSYLFREPMDFLPLFKDLPALSPPGGEEMSYCNAGYILLGLIIEELSKRPFGEFIETEVFAAAGMRDSAFLAMDEVHERVAIGYIEGPDGSVRTNHYALPVIGGPDGGAFTTVGDLLTFLDALESGVFFGADTWAVMRTPHSKDDDDLYGYGLWIGRTDSWFGGAGADPGYSARAFRYPDIDLDIAMLGNSIDATDEPTRVFRSALSSMG